MSIFNDGLLHVKLDMNKVEKGKLKIITAQNQKKRRETVFLSLGFGEFDCFCKEECNQG